MGICLQQAHDKQMMQERLGHWRLGGSAFKLLFETEFPIEILVKALDITLCLAWACPSHCFTCLTVMARLILASPESYISLALAAPSHRGGCHGTGWSHLIHHCYNLFGYYHSTTNHNNSKMCLRTTNTTKWSRSKPFYWGAPSQMKNYFQLSSC